MTAAGRLAYLEALKIPVWVSKAGRAGAEGPSESGLRLGPGSGSVLLLCAHAGEPAGLLASDIARAFDGEPVWAWPSADEPGVSAEAAVEARLFTTLVVFGRDLALKVFGKTRPEMVGPARVLVVPAVEELASQPSQRRSFWQTLHSRKLAARR